MSLRQTWECNKAAFLKNWPGGYEENFAVYTPAAGLTEQEIVDTCLKPYYNKEATALEIGCGKGFWVRRHLLPNFGKVIGVDIIPVDWVVKDRRFTYSEVAERNYELKELADCSIDFAWSFGVFCHLSLKSIQKYLTEIHRVLKSGKSASLYFSNKDKRPIPPIDSEPDPDETVGWTENDWPTTHKMLYLAGFNDIRQVLKHGKDTMAIVRK